MSLPDPGKSRGYTIIRIADPEVLRIKAKQRRKQREAERAKLEERSAKTAADALAVARQSMWNGRLGAFLTVLVPFLLLLVTR